MLLCHPLSLRVVYYTMCIVVHCYAKFHPLFSLYKKKFESQQWIFIYINHIDWYLVQILYNPSPFSVSTDLNTGVSWSQIHRMVLNRLLRCGRLRFRDINSLMGSYHDPTATKEEILTRTSRSHLQAFAKNAAFWCPWKCEHPLWAYRACLKNLVMKIYSQKYSTLFRSISGHISISAPSPYYPFAPSSNPEEHNFWLLI